MFFNSRDEDFLIQSFKAYVEEFGTDQVVLVVPESWRIYDAQNRNVFRLAYGREGKLTVWAPAFDAYTSVDIRSLKS